MAILPNGRIGTEQAIGVRPKCHDCPKDENEALKPVALAVSFSKNPKSDSVPTPIDVHWQSYREGKALFLLEVRQIPDNGEEVYVIVHVYFRRSALNQPSNFVAPYRMVQLGHKLWQMQQDGIATDVTLKFQDGDLRAHAVVLTAASPLFGEMPESPATDGHVFPFPDYVKRIGVFALEAIYTSNLPNNQITFDDLILLYLFDMRMN